MPVYKANYPAITAAPPIFGQPIFMWMAVYREHGPGTERINVGQITIVLSLTLRFFVKHRGNISAKMRQKNYRARNLEQNGGLQVPYHCVMCDFLPERTTHEKTETNAGRILAFQTRVSTTTQERKRVNNATRTRIYIILLNNSSSML